MITRVEHNNADFVPQIVFALDLDGKIVYLNTYGMDFFGLDNEKIGQGVHPTQFMVPEDHERLKNNISNIMRGAPLKGNLYTFIRRDGVRVSALVYSRPVYRDGKVSGITGIIIDISPVQERYAEFVQEAQVVRNRMQQLTAPIEPASEVDIYTLFDIRELQKLQDDFAETMGVASVITDSEGNPVTRLSNYTKYCSEYVRGTEEGMRRCRYSDEVFGKMDSDGVTTYECFSCGLLDGGTPIVVDNQRIGSWKIGQIRPKGMDIEKLVEYAVGLGGDEAGVRKAVEAIPVMPRERFDKIGEVLYLFSSQLSSMAIRNMQQAREIARRQELEKKLEETVQEQVALLNEVNHRVKNNLQVVSSLLSIQAHLTEDEKARAVFEEGRSRIRAMTLIHEMLYKTGRFKDVDFKEFLEMLLPGMEHIYSSVSTVFEIKLEAESIFLPVKTAVSVGLIVNELVTNAFKYAYDDKGGEIKVILKKDCNDCVLTVRDRGRGFPDDCVPDNSGTLGLKLSATLAAQLGGSLDFKSDNGVSALFRFPIPVI